MIPPPPPVKPQPGPIPVPPPPLHSYGPAPDHKVMPPLQVSPNPIPPPPPRYIPPGIQVVQLVTKQKNNAATIVYVVLMIFSLLVAIASLNSETGIVFAILAVVFLVLLIRTSRKRR